jgi:glycosyltransferase involved in cell wall biosynthesis
LERLILWIGVFATLACAGKLMELVYALRLMRFLGKETSAGTALGPRAPRLSLIVPALNEAETLEAAVQSMLRQDYPNLEILLINDRSTDATGDVMERLAGRDSRIRVIHIASLPDGWLGKNHALYVGARQASGDWLLFADADVHFDPTTFRRAVAYAAREQLDHLTLVPDLTARRFWLRSWVAFFQMAFITYQRPLLANDPSSPVGVGIGAFNLVRRPAYEGMGTHAAISLRPDDDLRLGQRLKLMGYRQRVLDGSGLLRVEWYPSLWEAIQGLEKNVFAGLNYNLAVAVWVLLLMAAVMIWPFCALFLVKGPAFWWYVATAALQLVTFVLANGNQGLRALALAPTLPVGAVLFGFTVARSTWLAVKRGGISWRGTFYSLGELRRQTGLEGAERR